MLDSFSWMDLIPAAVLIKVLWEASEDTIFGEIFKLLCVVLATFISLHFYSDLGAWIHQALILRDYSYAIAFWALFIGIYVLCYLAREGWTILMNIDPRRKNTLGAAVWISWLRAWMISGQVLIGCLVLNNSHIQQAFQQSMTGRWVTAVPIGFYQAVHYSLLNPFYSDEKINESLKSLLQTDPESVE